MIVDTTLSVETTVARILTAFIATGQIKGTIIVASTFRSFTAYQGITAITIGTVTSGLVIIVGTAHCLSTTLGIQAGISTLFIDASLSGWAFLIRATANQVTIIQGITSIALIADTQWSVALDMATGIETTNILQFTRILALLVHTGLVIAAIIIRDTFRFRYWHNINLLHATVVGRSIESGRTGTDSLMIDTGTNGIETAGIDTGIATFLIDTGAIA